MNTFIILLAAGKSSRLNLSVPKPYIKVNNKTLIEHSLDIFNKLKIKKKNHYCVQQKTQKVIKSN